MAKFQGAGEISIAKKSPTTGFPTTAFRFLGCVDAFDPKFSVQKTTPHYERCSGLGVLDAQQIKTRDGSLDLTFTEWTPANIAWALNGTIVAQGSPAVASAETLPEDIVDGDRWHLGAMTGTTHQNITGLTIHDSATVPNTLVLNTDYSLDAVYGTVKFLDISALTQPFVTNGYGYTDSEAVVIFNDPGVHYIVRFNSKNVFDQLSKGFEELYDVQFDPIGSLPGISDDFVPFSISGTIFADPSRQTDDTYGQFGRVVLAALAA